MRVSDFDFELPPELVAQVPAEPRDAARLLVYDRGPRRCHHAVVRELPDFLQPGDLLVVNDTRVMPWRLRGRRASGGRVEALILAREGSVCRGYVKPAAKLRVGEAVLMEGCLELRVEAVLGGGQLRFRLDVAPGARLGAEGGEIAAQVRGAALEGGSTAHQAPAAGSGGGVEPLRGLAGGASMRRGAVGAAAVGEAAPQDLLGAALERVGRAPLPPYIERDGSEQASVDRERYQTVFAEHPGAVAAPTAGLHFTAALLEALKARGVALARLTLHVGEGTFAPVRTERVEDHVMHAEEYVVPAATAASVAAARAAGGRVVAVGTTAARALEAAGGEDRLVRPGRGRTDLFLYPGRPLRVVDALMTNFHLPRSTLLMLVSAFAGRVEILRVYREAIARGYRFYSFGDAMLLR